MQESRHTDRQTARQTEQQVGASTGRHTGGQTADKTDRGVDSNHSTSQDAKHITLLLVPATKSHRGKIQELRTSVYIDGRHPNHIPIVGDRQVHILQLLDAGVLVLLQR